jgi:hypothetical protein
MARSRYVLDIAEKILKSHNVAMHHAGSSTSYYDFEGNCFDNPAPGRIPVSNRVDVNFEAICGAVEYELILQSPHMT